MQKKTSNYSLSNKADEDISSIAYYTIEEFGFKQARIYRDGLIEMFCFLALNPTLGRIFVLNNGVSIKRYKYKSHVIFFEQTTTGSILILRVLGGKMNFQKHL